MTHCLHSLILTDYTLVQSFFENEQFGSFCLNQTRDRDAGPCAHNFRNLFWSDLAAQQSLGQGCLLDTAFFCIFFLLCPGRERAALLIQFVEPLVEIFTNGEPRCLPLLNDELGFFKC